MGKGRIDTVAEVLRGIDQCAVEVEDEELQRFDRQGAEDADHGNSLKGVGNRGSEQGSGIRDL
jgi:hypothetical protein